MNKTALLVIDLINEIIDEKGALGPHGYTDFIKKNESLEKINQLIDFCNATGCAIPIFIRVEFSEDYREQLKNSPIFKDADKFGLFKKNTWSTQFHADLHIIDTDIVISKYRVSPFYGTNLKLILDDLKIEELLICGVSTQMAIESTVREAHDIGYSAIVIEDCCISSDEEVHNNSINNMKNFSEVLNLKTFLFKNNIKNI